MYDSIRFPSKFGLVPSTSPLIYDVLFLFILFVCLLVCVNAFDYFKIKQTSTGFKGKEKKDPDFLSLRPPPPPPLTMGESLYIGESDRVIPSGFFFDCERKDVYTN